MEKTILLFRIIFMNFFTYFTNQKIINKNIKTSPILLIEIIVSSFLILYIRLNVNYFSSIVFLILLLGILTSFNDNNSLTYSILLTVISFSMNYIIKFISLAIAFIVYKICYIKNDYINFAIMSIIHFIFLVKKCLEIHITMILFIYRKKHLIFLE